MLKVTSTKNNTGITISGDYDDLHELYECIENLSGLEGAYSGYECVCLNCLGFAYDIRHAFMGDREVEMVDNGVHEEMQKWHAKIMPKVNIYYSVNVLWTEVMFVVLAMNDYIELANDPKTYAAVLAELPEEIAVEQKKRVLYSISVVKLFQALVWQEFRAVVGDNRYSRIYKKTLSNYTYIKNLGYTGFCSQYIDELTVKYVATAIEKRPAKLAACVRSMIEKDSDYQDVQEGIWKFALENEVPISEVHIADLEYPTEIEW